MIGVKKTVVIALATALLAATPVLAKGHGHGASGHGASSQGASTAGSPGHGPTPSESYDTWGYEVDLSVVPGVSWITRVISGSLSRL